MFKTTKSRQASASVMELMKTQREDIKQRLAAVEEVSDKLYEAVRKTQEISVALTQKVNREMKIAKKSLTSISSKLAEGMVMINCEGRIIHVNRAGLKIFSLHESDVNGKTLGEILECATSNGQKPILQPDFFLNLTKRIFEKLKNNDPSEKYILCNSCLRDSIPFCFDGDVDAVLGVNVSCKGHVIPLRLTLTVLDNDPESDHDITYIILFSQDHK